MFEEKQSYKVWTDHFCLLDTEILIFLKFRVEFV